jgi:hypothetical protein
MANGEADEVVVPEHLLGFELRRIAFPPDVTTWQVTAWLAAQVTLWDQLNDVLDDERYDHPYYFAREQATQAKKMLDRLAPFGTGPLPGNLVDVINHLTRTVHTREIPAVSR